MRALWWLLAFVVVAGVATTTTTTTTTTQPLSSLSSSWLDDDVEFAEHSTAAALASTSWLDDADADADADDADTSFDYRQEAAAKQRASALVDVVDARAQSTLEACKTDFSTLAMSEQASAQTMCMAKLAALGARIIAADTKGADASLAGDVRDAERIVAKTQAHQLVRTIKEVTCPARLAFDNRFDSGARRVAAVERGEVLCWCEQLQALAFGKLAPLASLWPLFDQPREGTCSFDGAKKKKTKKNKKT